MEIKTTAGLITGLGIVEQFEILVTDKNCIKVKRKLALERGKALGFLKELKAQGKIKSLSIPRNPQLQHAIDITVKFKSDLDTSLESIRELFN